MYILGVSCWGHSFFGPVIMRTCLGQWLEDRGLLNIVTLGLIAVAPVDFLHTSKLFDDTPQQQKQKLAHIRMLTHASWIYYNYMLSKFIFKEHQQIMFPEIPHTFT